MSRGKFELAGHGSRNAFPGAGSTEAWTDPAIAIGRRASAKLAARRDDLSRPLPLLVREEPLPPLPR